MRHHLASRRPFPSRRCYVGITRPRQTYLSTHDSFRNDGEVALVQFCAFRSCITMWYRIDHDTTRHCLVFTSSLLVRKQMTCSSIATSPQWMANDCRPLNVFMSCFVRDSSRLVDSRRSIIRPLCHHGVGVQETCDGERS